MKSALTAASKQTAKSTASQSMTRNLNKDVWIRAGVLVVLVVLLYFLWTVVHGTGGQEAELNQAYVVYAICLLLLTGIGVLWR